MVSSIAVFLLVTASYAQARVGDDGLVYYTFMRRLAGEDVKAYAYQFGVVFWDLPFYLLSRLVTAARGTDSIDNLSIGVISVTFASIAAVIAIFYVAWRMLRDLGLRGGPGAILLTVFGSPLFYYAIFEPGLKHAFDALLASLLALLLVRASTHPKTTWIAVSMGGVVALAITVRYANITLLAGVLYVYLRKRAAVQAYAATVTAVAGAVAILLVPLVIGVPYGLPPAPTSQPAAAPSPHRTLQTALVAAAAPPRTTKGLNGVDDLTSFQLDPLAPAKMLFTLKRGLFVWTPLTIFGVVGYFLVLRRRADLRVFLTGLGLSMLALLVIHMVWGKAWEGGFSFSQRFLTDLFPLLVIGIAELLARTRMLLAPVLVACIAWTAFLAVHHFYGYDNVSDADGVVRIVDLYHTGEETPHTFWHERISGPISRHWRAYFDHLGL